MIRRVTRPWGAASLLVGVFFAMSASGQAPTLLTDPQQIAACLCLERSVNALAQDLLARSRVYEEKRRAVEALEQEIATRRPQVNVNDPREVDAFRQLLDRRNAAQAEFANQVTPQYSAAVETYNARVAAFNSQCASKAYDENVLATVRPNLSCPAP